MATEQTIAITGKKIRDFNLNDKAVEVSELESVVQKIDGRLETLGLSAETAESGISEIASGIEELQTKVQNLESAHADIKISDIDLMANMRSVLTDLIKTLGGTVKKSTMIKFQITDEDILNGTSEIDLELPAKTDPTLEYKIYWND